MKVKKKMIISLIFVAMLLMLKNVSYAGTQKWNSLDYNATLNDDGSMDVVETWDIYVSETNTLFKDFKLDRSKYSGITNVKVKNISTGAELTQIDEEMYHVTKDCYYGLPISGGKFEIAWGVGLDNSSANRKYAISYKIEDAVTVYNDCSELYWQFLGTDNTISAKKITGTIKLPKSVKDNENLRVWAHGPLNGEIQKTSNDTVTFFVNDFSSKTMLEVRVVTEEPIFRASTKVSSKDKLDAILEEEQKWANEANRQRNRAKCIVWIINIVLFIIIIFFFFKIIKYIRELKEVKNKRYHIDIGKYFRDIPREKEATPAEAAFLYYSKNNTSKFDNEISKIFSATLLQLCLKEYISFECENKKDIKINLLDNVKASNGKVREKLKLSENIVFRFLHKIAGSSNTSITMSQMKKFAKTNYDAFDNTMKELKERGKTANIEIGNYDKENANKANSYIAKAVIYLTALIFGVAFGMAILYALPALPILVIAVEFTICAILLKRTASKVNVLTEQGETERQQWKGLKKYMEDFSMLKEREIPELVLWEKYLVYATAFGISDKVIKQLKVVYPEMENMDYGGYTYMHLMSNSNFGNNFINDFNSGVNNVYSTYRSAYNAAHSSSSSGSGGGGGFSGGGGGRRWRWPDAVEDKTINI